MNDGPGPFVPPTYGHDPSRPRSAQFWMAPEMRRPMSDRPSLFFVKSNVPIAAQGNYPGTPAYPVGEAGETREERAARARAILAAQPDTYLAVRDWMQRYLSFYGAADQNVAQLDLVNWNDIANVTAAKESLRYQLERICQVDWGQTPWPNFGSMWESRAGFSDAMWETYRALVAKFCPAFSFRDEPPPPPMVTTTGTEVFSEDLPPDAPPPIPYPPQAPETFQPTSAISPPSSAMVPAEPYKAPRKYPNAGYWVGGSALILVVLGGAWYLSRKKPKRRKNPSRRENPSTMAGHSYEHGFLEGFDTAKKAFKTSNPCGARPPAARANPRSRRKSPRRRKAPKRRKNSYSGKIQHPSPQYDVMGYARTPLLQDMPGATWEPRTHRKLNPKSSPFPKRFTANGFNFFHVGRGEYIVNERGEFRGSVKKSKGKWVATKGYPSAPEKAVSLANAFLVKKKNPKRKLNPLTKKQQSAITHGSMSPETAEEKLSELEEELSETLLKLERSKSRATGEKARRQLLQLKKLASYTMSPGDAAEFVEGYRGQLQMRVNPKRRSIKPKKRAKASKTEIEKAQRQLASLKQRRERYGKSGNWPKFWKLEADHDRAVRKLAHLADPQYPGGF